MNATRSSHAPASPPPSLTKPPSASVSIFFCTAYFCAVAFLISFDAVDSSLLVHKYSTRVVKTKYGALRGVMIHIHPPVEAFLGVPYATPPVGSLRQSAECGSVVYPIRMSAEIENGDGVISVVEKENAPWR
ncbi:hypothetical protein GWI33_013305 [Rhynchophorus ferrugineus]|uniref:Carboxylesterase type B domain-containing protein n=1 Tax=Rhynchophorus ferrugineus TaxID=354439 RepID=A0A834I6R8_RHYFE|nr:hypothetical protein GWI33_013305 [Rhynchophorus ferrugineus]